MINSLEINKYTETYQDFLHPNPNISSKATYILRKEFRIEFIDNLLINLEEADIVIRRKSILALGEFGEDIFNYIVPLYFKNKNKNIKVSCLKTIIKVIVNSIIPKIDIIKLRYEVKNKFRVNIKIIIKIRIANIFIEHINNNFE